MGFFGKKIIQQDDHSRFIDEAFHKVHRYAYGHSIYEAKKEWDEWHAIRVSGRSVKLESGLLCECLKDQKVIWIAESDLKFPIQR